MPGYQNIYDLSYEALSTRLTTWGEPAYRTAQIWEGLYRQLWNSPAEFSNLPKSLRQQLAVGFAHTEIKPEIQPTFNNLQPFRKLVSADGETTKTLFSLHDGHIIEAVLMRYAKRRTLCISTQAGCAMGCVFCATGQMGFHRQLSSGEIIEQVLYYARLLAGKQEQVTNVVVMGMGEPFHNYETTLSAVKRLNDPHGYNLGARRFTISTVGVIPGIRRFTNEQTQVNLAVSLHAADDNLRTQLLPINKKYPLSQLLPACLDYVSTTHRRISFEWALIQGVNDTTLQAHLLGEMLQIFRLEGSILCHVNVIQLNPTPNYSEIAATHQSASTFQHILEQAGIPCTIRIRRGIEIQAGCGQLAGEVNNLNHVDDIS